MADHNTPSLHTLPIYLIHRIMDNLDPEALLFSLRDVCTRINIIMDNYEPYKVYFTLPFSCKTGMTISYCKDISLQSIVSYRIKILICRNTDGNTW